MSTFLTRSNIACVQYNKLRDLPYNDWIVTWQFYEHFEDHIVWYRFSSGLDYGSLMDEAPSDITYIEKENGKVVSCYSADLTDGKISNYYEFFYEYNETGQVAYIHSKWPNLDPCIEEHWRLFHEEAGVRLEKFSKKQDKWVQFYPEPKRGSKSA